MENFGDKSVNFNVNFAFKSVNLQEIYAEFTFKSVNLW